MRFSDLRVGIKLSIAFGLLLCVTMALGAVSLWQVSRLDQTIEVMGEDAMPSLSIASDLRIQWNRFRRVETLMLLDQASGINNKYAKDLQDFRRTIEASEGKYAKLPLSASEQQLFTQYHHLSDAYLKVSDAMVKSATDQFGNPLNTMQIYEEQGEKHLSPWRKSRARWVRQRVKTPSKQGLMLMASLKVRSCGSFLACWSVLHCHRCLLSGSRAPLLRQWARRWAWPT